VATIKVPTLAEYYSPLRVSSLKCSLQEDTVVFMHHTVLSLSMRVPGGLSVHSLSENVYGGKSGHNSATNACSTPSIETSRETCLNLYGQVRCYGV